MAGPIAVQTGGYLTQLAIYDQSFETVDQRMALPEKERRALSLQNTYASAYALEGRVVADSRDLDPDYKPDNAVWFRPYGSIENVEMGADAKVHNKQFGTLIGVDMYQNLPRGLDGIGTLFVGYNYSNQDYRSASIDQNGVTLGFNETIYKSRFFNSTTVNFSGNFADTSGAQGGGRLPMLIGGLANKTGYNFEFFDGKFIIQPNMQLSYTFAKAFNYTAMGNVEVDAKALNAIQVQPGVKLIGNVKNWQPYMNFDFIWTMMDKTNFKANDIALTKLSVDPYFEMGLGVKRKIVDRLDVNAQATLRMGGRSGIAFQAGLKYELGKKDK